MTRRIGPARKAPPPVEPTPARPSAPPAPKPAQYVTVACKIPSGVVLQLCKKTTYFEETMTGARERQRWDKGGRTVTVRGPAYPNGVVPANFPEKPQIVGGYALTPGIDADFFDDWLEQNKLNPIVENHMIFAFDRHDDAVAASKEHRALLSGLEPLVPGNDPRIPRPTTTSITPIETDDRAA
jgi:hypothetical protein